MEDEEEQDRKSPITRQEMFDRAVRGLASQGWRPATDGPSCVYLTPDGRRCAWGWVDPEGTTLPGGLAAPVTGLVRSLAEDGVGLAAKLSREDVRFAQRLQRAHDSVSSEEDWSCRTPMDSELRLNMRQFAVDEGLDWPEGL